MPHIRMRSLEKKNVKNLSESLLPDLARIIGTDEDNFTFELVGTDFFYRGKETASFPFIEVFWFARSQEIQDQTARFITEKVKAESGAEDVVVVFQVLEKASYYENTKHF